MYITMHRSFRQVSASWIESHLAQSYRAFVDLLFSPWQSLSLVLVISTAITLTSISHLAQKNLHGYGEEQVASSYLQVMLKDSVTQKQRVDLSKSLNNYPTIIKIDVISKEQAAKDFLEHTQLHNIDFGKHNPLPSSIIGYIKPKTPLSNMQTIKDNLQKNPLVLEVILNQSWAKNIESWMIALERILLLISAMIILGCIFVIGNAVSLKMQQHKTEIYIIKIVGGTDAFICRPYIYTGCYLGIISGALAVLIIKMSWQVLLPTLSNLPIDNIPSNPLDMPDIVTIMLYSSTICWLITYLSAKIYLKQNHHA